MDGTFILVPTSGSSFDSGVFRRFLLSHSNAIAVSGRPYFLVITASLERSNAIANSIASNPDVPQWAVFADIRHDSVVVYREAMSEDLEYFKPILVKMLEQFRFEILDEERKPLKFESNDEAAAYLLG